MMPKEYQVEVQFKSHAQFTVTADSKKDAVELVRYDGGDNMLTWLSEFHDFQWSTATVTEIKEG